MYIQALNRFVLEAMGIIYSNNKVLAFLGVTE